MKQKRRIAIDAIEKAAAQFPNIGQGWSAVETIDRLMLQGTQAQMAGLWRDAEVRAVWNEALSKFWMARERATPPGFWDDFERLKQRDINGLESGIAFLEADPYFFRSGYIKEWISTFVRRLPLDDSQQQRLRRVVLHIVETRDGREFRFFCRLARRVADDELRHELQKLLQHEDRDIRRRATWMLNYCRPQK